MVQMTKEQRVHLRMILIDTYMRDIATDEAIDQIDTLINEIVREAIIDEQDRGK
jgi:hypothetical protein